MQAAHDNRRLPGDGDDPLDPRQAAALLDQTTRDARRQFDRHPPVVMAPIAALVLVAYGALWLSTREQHPYHGPSGAAIALLYTVVGLSAIVGTKVYQRATSGVSGASIGQERVEKLALGLSAAGSPMIQAAMHHAHASLAIVYGIIPAAGPLIIIGTTLVGIAGTNSDWPGLLAALIVVPAGMVALFVGPSRAWLAAGIGVSIAIVGYAVAHAKVRARREMAWAPTASTR